jgi:hypothetical protein
LTPHEPVWREALPYLRARKSDIHVPISYRYAERLVERNPDADAEVVLLGILLHDVGWASVDAAAIFTEGFGPRAISSNIRFQHEKEGARIARDILERLGYATRVVDPVTAIIDGHDTRRHAISHEDELVKDADKLWRFTPTGVGIACDWFESTPADYGEHLERDILPQLFTDAARELALAEFERTRRLLLLDVLRD